METRHVASRPLLTESQAKAQRAFAAVAIPATVRPCWLCDGVPREPRDGSYDPCPECMGAGREVVGQLPEPNELAARLECAVEMEGQLRNPEVPDWALDLMALAAATLRAASKGE